MSSSANNSVLAKADWALADITSNGGLLSVEQSTEFIRKLVIEPTLLKMMRVFPMTSHTHKLNKIGFGGRILRPAVQSVAVSSGDRVKPTTSQVTLTNKEVIAELRLPYDIVEQNIERAAVNESIAPGPVGNSPFGGGIKDTIIDMIVEQAAPDLEELILLGDTTSGDAYLAQFDGVLKLSTTNVVAVGGGVSNSMFSRGLKAIPLKYLRNLPSMKHFLPTTRVLDYSTYLASRETALGDAKIQSLTGINGMGVPVEMVHQLPVAQGLLTAPLNLIFGIGREIQIEVEKDIRLREYVIVLTAKVGFAIEEEEAVVKYTGITDLA